jgi:2-polyprenyl-3-methyl-5-hydroxy-6-metoxy-1,4-benzoquinol methylase
MTNPSASTLMNELSEKKHWDTVHQSQVEQADAFPLVPTPKTSSRKLKDRVKKLFGKRVFDYMLCSYHRYLFWNVLLKKYLPDARGAKLLEVGSAPGTISLQFHNETGCVPYGVEYSEPGVEANRQLFALNGLDPANVIHADFLADQLHTQYKESFDIVFSGGFIEHFADAREVVNRHVNLLHKGGHLIITIPNLRGVNYLLLRLFHKELLDIHNLNIMRKREFEKLFDTEQLTPLYCNYYGTFSFDVLAAKDGSLWRFPLAVLKKSELLLNLLFRLVLRGRGLDSRVNSPYLIFIGVKK